MIGLATSERSRPLPQRRGGPFAADIHGFAQAFLRILGIGLWPTENELGDQIALETRLKDQGQGDDRANGFRRNDQPRVTHLTRTAQTY